MTITAMGRFWRTQWDAYKPGDELVMPWVHFDEEGNDIWTGIRRTIASVGCGQVEGLTVGEISDVVASTCAPFEQSDGVLQVAAMLDVPVQAWVWKLTLEGR